MKSLLFIFVLVVLISCNQNQPKEIAKNDSIPKTLAIDTVEINDSTSFDNYSVDIDTVFFYARADSNTKMNTYLTKNTTTVICKKMGEFGYSVRLTDSVIQPQGWLKLKYLTQIYFTPPKIEKN